MLKIKRLTIIFFITILLASCSTGKLYFKKAEDLNRDDKIIESIEYYMKAVRKNPEEARYRLKLMEVLIEGANYYYRLAMEYKDKKNYQLAIIELNKALEYNPSNNMAKLEKRELLKKLSGDSKKIEKTWIEKIKERTALSRKQLFPSDKELVTLNFNKDVPLREIFKTIAKMQNINILFDSNFKNSKMKIKMTDVSLYKAFERICSLKNLFYKVLDKKTILIIPDTKTKRKLYMEQIIKSFYLSNIKSDECMKLITKITRIKNIVSNKHLNTLTVRDIPHRVALVEKLIHFFDKKKSEVLIKIDIMEVNKDRLKEYGIELSQYQFGQSVNSGTDTSSISGNRLSYLDSSDLSYTIPTILYKMLENDTNSKVIARPQVRGEDGEKIIIKLGDKVPVPRTSFVPYSQGGQNSQPITSFDLQEVGIDISIIPHVHHNADISLELDFKLTFITSPGTTTLPPTIGNRSVKTKLRLKDGETGIMAGLLRDSERNSVKGFPGIASIPILRDIFSSNRKQIAQTDIIIRVTPYIMRMPDIDEKELYPIESGTETNIRLVNKKENEKNIKNENKK
jgi:general secretion pathway protein D